MGAAVALHGGLFAQEVERARLCSHHLLQQVDFVGEFAREFHVGQRVGALVVAAAFEPGIAAGGPERLGLHHHAVEIVVARGDVAYHGNGFVGSPAEFVDAELQALVFGAQHALLGEVECDVKRCHRPDGHGRAHRTMAQRRRNALPRAGIDTLVLPRGGVHAVECFLAH